MYFINYETILGWGYLQYEKIKSHNITNVEKHCLNLSSDIVAAARLPTLCQVLFIN